MIPMTRRRAAGRRPIDEIEADFLAFLTTKAAPQSTSTSQVMTLSSESSRSGS